MSQKSPDQMTYKNETVYILFKQVQKVPEQKVLLGQAGKIHCSTGEIEAGCRCLQLYRFREKEEKKGFSVLEVIALIESHYPGITVNNVGTPDFLLEYEGARSSSKSLAVLKVILVSMFAFFGAAFAIMTFNNDADVTNIFTDLYQWFTGRDPAGPTVLEAGYSLGLPFGILFFFNHIGKRTDRKDPTPLEVQMRIYADDHAASVIQKEEEG